MLGRWLVPMIRNILRQRGPSPTARAIRIALTWTFFALAAYSLQRLAGGPPPDSMTPIVWFGEATSWFNSILTGDLAVFPDAERLNWAFRDPVPLRSIRAVIATAGWVLIGWLAAARMFSHLLALADYLDDSRDAPRGRTGLSGRIALIQFHIQPPLSGILMHAMVISAVTLMITIGYRIADDLARIPRARRRSARHPVPRLPSR